MTQTPYNPMHAAQKQVSMEDMWSTLESHPGCHRPTVGQSPKEKSAIALPPLEWDKPVKTGDNAGFVLSLCGRYSISKDSVRGKAMYSAWLRRQGETPERMIGIRDHREEAERMCELDRK